MSEVIWPAHAAARLGARRYATTIDLGVDNAHTRVVRLVGQGKRVLELGCATGYMSRVLVQQFGCVVVGVERDAEAAEEAKKACGRVIVADLDAPDWDRELGNERFDVVLCADVLEHLRDPAGVLRAARAWLAADGYLVASIPNIAHASVLAELLDGRFRYRPLGLLDDTHLRFFTLDSIYDCLETAGFVVTHLERLRVDPEATEFRTDLSRLPVEVAAFLRSLEEGTTYQFVLTAGPAPAEGGVVALAETLARTGVDAAPRMEIPAPGPERPAETGDAGMFWRLRVEAVMAAVLARMRFLEDERSREAGELGELRERVVRLQSEVAGHTAHVRFLQDEVGRRDAEYQQELGRRDAGHQQELGRRAAEYQQELGRRDAEHQQELERRAAELARYANELAERQRLVAAMESTRGWRLLQRLRRLRATAFPAGSRRERLYLAVLEALERRAGKGH